MQRFARYNVVFFRRVFLLLLSAVLLTASISVCAFAEGEDDLTFPSGENCRRVRVYLDGLLMTDAYYYNDTLWFPFEDLYGYYHDAPVFRDDQPNQLTLTSEELRMEIHAEDTYLCINSRYLFLPQGYHLNAKGDLYLPEEVTRRIFGFVPVLTRDYERCDLSSSDYRFIEGGETYYADHFSNDDHYWLSHIISSEAGHSQLDGMIAVGNVVVNRVNHELFPDTIYDVIFDWNNGPQFQPVYNGKIYDTPCLLACIAAYLTLEGYVTAPDAIYFVEEWVPHDWLYEGTFVVQYMAHRFYRG